MIHQPIRERRRYSRSSLPTAVAVALFLIAGAASAQTSIHGTVRDSVTATPLQGAPVLLLASDGSVRQITTTDALGRFWLVTGARGEFRVEARYAGYHTRRTALISTLSTGDTLTLRLVSFTYALDPLIVVGRAGSRSPALDGFYRRVDLGLGHHLTYRDIQRRNALQLGDLLRELPGVRLHHTDSGGRKPYMSRVSYRDDGCPVQIYLDGVLMNRRLAQADSPGDTLHSFSIGDDDGFDIDHLVIPSDIEGIELYPGLASTPAEFIGSDARCGTIAIWTKRP